MAGVGRDTSIAGLINISSKKLTKGLVWGSHGWYFYFLNIN